MATLGNTKTVVALTHQQANTLQQGNQLESVADLNDSLRATYLLITGPWGQYEIYHQGRQILQFPGLSNLRDIHDYGVHEAAAAGLIAAVLTNNTDITKIMEEAIIARLRENAGLPPD